MFITWAHSKRAAGQSRETRARRGEFRCRREGASNKMVDPFRGGFRQKKPATPSSVCHYFEKHPRAENGALGQQSGVNPLVPSFGSLVDSWVHMTHVKGAPEHPAKKDKQKKKKLETDWPERPGQAKDGHDTSEVPKATVLSTAAPRQAGRTHWGC